MKMVDSALFRLITIGSAVALGIFDRIPEINEVGENTRGLMMSRLREDVQRVVVVVYYEPLCRDSQNFFTNQLKPTYRKLGANLDVQMIPYGKASTKSGPDGYSFQCQHGPKECEANKIHACAINVIKNPSVQLKFLSCMMKHKQQPQNITRTCSERLHVNAESIFDCYKSSRGASLLAAYGEMTNALSPPISFIPTITIENDSSNQAEILRDLRNEVCKHFEILPAGCY